MTQEQVRKLILKALYMDDWLYHHLVFKGGSALSLVYDVGGRSSLDLDFSMEGDFEDTRHVSRLMAQALASTFDKVGIVVFDFKLTEKPRSRDPPWWGGYMAEFKLIVESQAATLNFGIEDMRRQALTIDPGSQRRRYRIEISKFEYVAEKVLRRVDDVDVYVYPPLLIAVEKLRALLQQHPEYPQIPGNLKRSRAQDLYDIWAISEHFAVKLDMHLSMVEAVFGAKKVDLGLLGRLPELKSLHMASWPNVELSVATDLEDFDFYFDFVNASARSLYTQWIEHSP
jgi:hypothetical protein